MDWNAEATRERIREVFGQAQLDLADPPLASVQRRQSYAQYHFQQSNDLLNTFVTTRLPGTSLLDVVLCADNPLRSEYYEMLMKIGAHLTACVESMHAIFDTWSHVVYYALGLNRESRPLSESKIRASEVRNLISGRPDLEPVHRRLSELIEDPGFEYLNALANHGKHRSIIRNSIGERLHSSGLDRVRIGFVAFQYKNKTYSETDVQMFLTAEFSRQVQLCVSIGIAIDEVLQSRVA